MSLSITKRLTVTSAVLSTAALAPLGAVLYTMAVGSLEEESSLTAQARATEMAEAIEAQWDEDLLVEFGGSKSIFEQIKLEFDDWAIVRGDQPAVRAEGAFADEPELILREGSGRLQMAGGKSLRVAAVPLLEPHGVHFQDLPEAVRAHVSQPSPRSVFLRAKREVAGGKSTIEVKILDGGQVHETKVLESGEVLSRKVEELPAALPADVMDAIPEARGDGASFSVRWTATHAQLIAVLEGKTAEGQPFTVAVNRLGERFTLTPEGEVDGPIQESRLLLVMGTDASSETAAEHRLLASLCLGGPLVWLIMVFGGWYVARKAMSPVKDIVVAARRIRLAQLGERLPVTRVNDELSQIASTINSMLDRIQQGYEREHQFTGDASHELRSPLAKVIAEIDLALSRDRDGAEYRETLERCRGYAQSMQRLVDSLLVLARLDSGASALSMGPFDLGELAVEVIRAMAEDSGRIRLELGSSSQPHVVRGDRGLIRILLRNLLDNALRYSPPDSPVLLTVRREADRIEAWVEDEGPGIPEEQLQLVFHRFYRIEKSRSRSTGGVGLGLAIAMAIATAHSARLELTRRRAGGTRAVLRLSAAAGPGRVAPKGAAGAAA